VLTIKCFIQGGEVEAPDGMTPLDAVVRILNNQLTSLMWIDEKVCICQMFYTFLEPCRILNVQTFPSEFSLFLRVI
jgi:hypothetical protein